MGTLSRIKRARPVPTPVGTPALVYVPYSFGQMKPIPFIPLTVHLSPVFQNYAKVFIPKNSWGTLKIINVRFGIIVTTLLPNQPGGPLYQERYDIPGIAQTARLGNINQGVAAKQTKAWIERNFIYDGVQAYELNYAGAVPNMSASSGDGLDHRLAVTGVITLFDNTVDNYLNFQLKTTFAGGTDTIQTYTGQAFIQSPLDLRRLSS